MQQILLIMVGMRQGVLVRQPVILLHQRRQPQGHRVQQRLRLADLAMQDVNVLNKMA